MLKMIGSLDIDSDDAVDVFGVPRLVICGYNDKH